jgi:protein-glucosylgalactosylhydroxylysine glucosidase
MKTICCFVYLTCIVCSVSGQIDRFALVTRHNVHLDKFHEFSSLSVGNGKFAFTADVTGLQSFPQAYANGIPLTTMAEWGWHSFPNTESHKLQDTFEMIDTQGRLVSYNSIQKGPAADYLRANPHQITLGLIGLVLTKSDGTRAKQDEITNIDQQLRLWEGVLVSSFEFDGKPVTVRTCVHPQMDMVAVQIVSPLIGQRRIGVSLRFPYAAGTWGRDPADWSVPEKHQTKLQPSPSFQSVFERIMDDKRYYCRASFSEGGSLKKIDTHEYHMIPANSGDRFECSVLFQESSEFPETVPFEKAQSVVTDYWKTFWSAGGAIDLSQSADSRWKELERRIVLSQYLTAIQSQQKYPSQETGLTCNSWFGKFHIEMHWWHSVHFALWDRLPMLERSIGWYSEILPAARQIAERQGYKGVRWPKMTEPAGQDSPSGIGALLIWQQPHPIYFAELVYRQKPTPETLEQYKEIVFETAEFMASYIRWNGDSKSFVLGPPLIPAQENYDRDTTWNPT